VNCPAVRDRLPEHALGVADRHDATAIERHLAWCAACRKEARDLERATATMAFALAPADPAPELAERVIGAVRRVSAPTQAGRSARSRRRRAGVILLAAALTVAGLGAGAVLGHRNGPPAPASVRGGQDEVALAKFEAAIQAARSTDPNIQADIGKLSPTKGFDGSGAALTLASRNEHDQVIVWVTGLRARPVPYLVSLADGRGNAIDVARIGKLDRDGGAMLARFASRNLARYDRIVVQDGKGRIVLSGSLVPATTTP